MQDDETTAEFYGEFKELYEEVFGEWGRPISDTIHSRNESRVSEDPGGYNDN